MNWVQSFVFFAYFLQVGSQFDEKLHLDISILSAKISLYQGIHVKKEAITERYGTEHISLEPARERERERERETIRTMRDVGCDRSTEADSHVLLSDRSPEADSDVLLSACPLEASTDLFSDCSLEAD